MSSQKELVLVTGANGYIASMLVKTLLEQGYKVRGTVRSLTDEKKTASLKSLPKADENLELVALNLEDELPVFETTVKDVAWIMHTAQYTTLVESDENTVIGPAVKGVQSILEAAYKEKTVTKFIFTSSVAAVESGRKIPPDQAFGPNDWSDLEGPNVTAYAKAKTKAEKYIWDFITKHSDANFTVSSLHPVFVLGPVVNPHAPLTSMEGIEQTFRGQNPGVIQVYWPIVDVRDVAEAHIRAAHTPEAAGKRFILCQTDGGELFFNDVAQILANNFNPMGYRIRTNIIPKWLVWLLTWVDRTVAALFHMVGNSHHYDATMSREILRLEYTPVEKTILDGAHSLIQQGLVPKMEGYKPPS